MDRIVKVKTLHNIKYSRIRRSLWSTNFNALRISTLYNRGFTLIETLVAVMILSLALAGTLTIVSRSVTSSVFARDQIIAFYLAQEAVEYVQNKRSSNVLEGKDWLTDLGPCISGPCAIWINTLGTIQIRPSSNCTGQACQPLKLNAGDPDPLYNHNPPSGGNEQTIFSREIKILPIDYDGVGLDGVGDEIAVSVKISWKSGTVERDFTIQHNILNWQE